MNRLLFLTLIFSLGIIGSQALTEPRKVSPTPYNDYTYHNGVNRWMRLHRSPATWFQARLRCHNEGSMLASPLDETLQDTMITVMGRRTPTIFTGISSNIVKDEFISVEGISLDDIPTAWVHMDPGQELCIGMRSNGTLEDVSCTKPRPYICYKQNTNNMPQLNQCGTSDLEYIYEKETGHCYKFHKIGQRWADAYKTCLVEGGYLAIINSKTEAKVLQKIAAKFPAEVVTARYLNTFSIGFHDWSDHKLWMTIHGEKLEQAGYSSWVSGHPSASSYFCGAMMRDGLVKDVSCDVTFAFICEMDVRTAEIDLRTAPFMS